MIFWFKRFGISLAVITFIIWIGAWFFLSGAATATSSWTKNKILSASVAAGFGIENVLVEGRVHSDQDVLLSLLNVQKGDALFGVDIQKSKEQIEKISWIKNVSIKRQLPDTLFLRLEERRPIGLWQRDNKVSLIDDEGIILSGKNIEKFKDLIIFTGQNVNKEAGSFLSILQAEPLLFNKVEAAQFVSNRRWNIRLKNGLLVKLPEKELSFALSQLVEYQEQDSLLDKKIKSLDVRMFPRIIVQTFPGSAYSYNANYESQENAI